MKEKIGAGTLQRKLHYLTLFFKTVFILFKLVFFFTFRSQPHEPEPEPGQDWTGFTILLIEQLVVGWLIDFLNPSCHVFRFANLYFLFIVLLNWVPAINAFGKEISMLPVILGKTDRTPVSSTFFMKIFVLFQLERPGGKITFINNIRKCFGSVCVFYWSGSSLISEYRFRIQIFVFTLSEILNTSFITTAGLFKNGGLERTVY